MSVVTILIASIITCFFVGFLFQNVYQTLINKDTLPFKSASSLFIKIFRIHLHKLIMKAASFFSKKNRVYISEMKKPLTLGKLERNLFNQLLFETNVAKMNRILETVFYFMEKNNRRLDKNKTFIQRNIFELDKIRIKDGFGYGLTQVQYVSLFISYNGYLRGQYMESNLAKDAARIFGTPLEVNALAIYLETCEDDAERRII